MNNWRNVWERKGAEAADAPPRLERLLAANGYDTGYAGISPEAWNDHVDRVLDRLGAKTGHTFYEVGCGSGAFLVPIHQRGFTVAGCDYSSTLVALAARTIRGAHVECCQASEIPVLPQYDFVVSSGVFHYFSDHDYAAAVITAMAEKARHGVAILDLPDLVHKEANLQLRYQVAGSKEEYEKRFSGLDHLFYERDWMVQLMKTAGLQSVDVSDQNIAGYPNGLSRFNVFARRI